MTSYLEQMAHALCVCLVLPDELTQTPEATSNWRILHGDARHAMAAIQDGSVQTCVTSPPYWGLRDYGHEGQLGLEPTPDAYVAALVVVFREVRRVLRDDGTVWLNLGDSYAQAEQRHRNKQMNTTLRVAGDGSAEAWATGTAQTGRKLRHGLKPKDLIGIPWRVAFALQADGWYLRSDIIWSKPNPMPESVTDRPTKSHEYIFLLSKSARYYYDDEAIADDAVCVLRGREARNGEDAVARKARGHDNHLGTYATRNKRSVWTVTTQPYAEAHFATFPEKLIEPCILAGSSVGDTVLDPFTGSGTTGAVAVRHQRNFIGCELNAEYVALAERRIGAVAPLFASGDVQAAGSPDVTRTDGQTEIIFGETA